MSDKPFFRQVADQALDHETQRHIDEQKAALAKNPEWAEGYYHLAQFYRIQQKPREAKEQLLIALGKKPTLADAHVALGEIYLSEGDMKLARQHAEWGAKFGNSRLLEQLGRYGA